MGRFVSGELRRGETLLFTMQLKRPHGHIRAVLFEALVDRTDGMAGLANDLKP
jgi:hypothetical protein